MPDRSDNISSSLPFTVFKSPLNASTSFLRSLKTSDFSESTAVDKGRQADGEGEEKG